METIEKLSQVRARHPSPPPAGSAAETQALARFAEFFSSLASDRVKALVPETYAEDVYFNDTLKAIEGRDALAHYLRESAEAVEACRVEIHETTRTEHGEHLVRWSMMIRFKKFRRGVDTWSIGMSHLRFDASGHVVYHQDYWNAADGLFQHIPLIGTLIAAVKRRL